MWSFGHLFNNMGTLEIRFSLFPWVLFSFVCLIFGCTGSSLQHVGSVVVLCRLSCPVACGILLPQPGVEPGPLAEVAQILPLGIPRIQFLNPLSRSWAFPFPTPRGFLNISPNCALSIQFICLYAMCLPVLHSQKRRKIFSPSTV